jgi:hypothetical protein
MVSMKAIETALANPRLDRIKLVSRLAKFVCYGVLIYSIGYLLLFPIMASDGRLAISRSTVAMMMVVIQAGLWGAFIKLKQLPHFNDRFPLVPLMALAQIFLWIGYWKLPSAHPGLEAGTHNSFWILYQISMWVWYWKLARLFGFYERGMTFAAETIRCIKILGLLCIIGWFLGTMSHFVMPPVPLAGPSGKLIMSHTLHTTSMTIWHTSYFGFFSFDFGTGINFGQFFIGVIIVLIAWIMDEGRKIQEEQELTV